MFCGLCLDFLLVWFLGSKWFVWGKLCSLLNCRLILMLALWVCWREGVRLIELLLIVQL